MKSSQQVLGVCVLKHSVHCHQTVTWNTWCDTKCNR